MGFIQRLINRAKVRAHVEGLLSSGSHVFLDTNIIIFLAEGGKQDVALLDTLVHDPRFRLLDLNVREIQGLLHFGRITHSARSLLQQFIVACLNQRGKILSAAPSSVHTEMASLVALLPRKLVHDVLINDPMSFLNQLIQKYTLLKNKLLQGTLQQHDIDQVSAWRHSMEKDLRGIFEQRFIELCDSLRIDDYQLDQREYFREVDQFKKQILNEIARSMEQPFDIAIITLKQIAQKAYVADVRFAAEVVSHAATALSEDSDVIWLEALHAARRP